jgi:hypothetical protein
MAKSLSPRARASSAAQTVYAIHPLLEAHDRCNDLRDITDAYNALENLISPECDKPHESVQATRCELRALLALMNAETGRRIETAIRAVEIAREND